MVEKNLLSTVLNNPNLYADLKQYDFFQDKTCKHLYEIIKMLFNTREFNQNILQNHIVSTQCFSFTEYIDILESDTSEDNYKIYLGELLREDLNRRLHSFCIEANANKTLTYIDIKSKLQDMIDQTKDSDEQEIKDSKDMCLKLVERLKKDYSPPKVYSGIEEIEDKQGGYDVTDYIIIGAEQSVGKTSFALDCMKKQLMQKMKIGVFSCEMLRDKIYQLLACNIAKINSNSIDMKTASEVDKTKYISAIEKLYESDLYVDDSTREWSQVKKKIKILKKEKKIDIIYIDYLQYLRSGKKNMYERLEEISNDIKQLNKLLRVPIVCIATLNRSGKQEEPFAHHIKGNGDIEYDADIILLLQTINKAIEGNYYNRLVKFFIRKNRNGRQGDFNLVFKTDTREFINEIGNYNEYSLPYKE